MTLLFRLSWFHHRPYWVSDISGTIHVFENILIYIEYSHCQFRVDGLYVCPGTLRRRCFRTFTQLWMFEPTSVPRSCHLCCFNGSSPDSHAWIDGVNNLLFWEGSQFIVGGGGNLYHRTNTDKRHLDENYFCQGNWNLHELHGRFDLGKYHLKHEYPPEGCLELNWKCPDMTKTRRIGLRNLQKLETGWMKHGKHDGKNNENLLRNFLWHKWTENLMITKS
jgi:hypothetical protein